MPIANDHHLTMSPHCCRLILFPGQPEGNCWTSFPIFKEVDHVTREKTGNRFDKVDTSSDKLGSCKFVCKVSNKEPVTQARYPYRTWQQIKLITGNSATINNSRVSLYLCDEDVALSNFFDRGDVIFVTSPHGYFEQGQECSFYAGPSTVLCVYPRNRNKSAKPEVEMVGDTPIVVDESGIIDCTFMRKRLCISEFILRLSNLSFLGVITSVKKKEDSKHFVMGVEDETKDIDVIIDPDNHKISKFWPGQLVLIKGAETYQGFSQPHVVLEMPRNSIIYNLSCLKGILSCTTLISGTGGGGTKCASMFPRHSFSRPPRQNSICLCTVIGFQLGKPEFNVLHAPCHRISKPQGGDMYFCELCNIPFFEHVLDYNVRWQLSCEDHTAFALGNAESNEEMIDFAAKELQKESRSTIESLVKLVVGKQFVFSLSRDKKEIFHIDQIAEP